jgi:hypothetical protein
MIKFKVIDCLIEASKHNDVSILVFASHKRYGGGYRNHSKAQEEYLFNNTDLANRYTEEIANFYPFKYEDTKGFKVKAKLKNSFIYQNYGSLKDYDFDSLKEKEITFILCHL